MKTVEEYIHDVLGEKYDKHLTPVAVGQKRQLSAVVSRTPRISSIDEFNTIVARETHVNRLYYQQLTQEYANILNSDVRSLNQKLEEQRALVRSKTAADVSFYAKEFGQVAETATFFATMCGSSKGAAISTIASGALSLGTSLSTVIAAGSMSFGAGAAIAVAAMTIMQGFQGLFDGDDDERGGGLAEAFNAIINGLFQISQQINHLGKYIEARFDHLEKTVELNHKIEMAALRSLLFRTDLNHIQLKDFLRTHNTDVKQKLDKVSTELQTVIAHGQAQYVAGLRSKYVVLKEFHFLQIKPERTLVNKVKQLLDRKGINDENFVKYSSGLCRSITMESHGSETLTGRDLRSDDMESITSRLILPLEKSETDQDIEHIAAYNIDYLKAIAAGHGAVIEADFQLPNLSVYKERCLVFYDWQYAYAEFKRDPGHRIPESAYQDLTAVVASLEKVNQFLHSVNLKPVMLGLLGKIRVDYLLLQTQIDKKIEEFEIAVTQSMLAQRLKYTEKIEALLPHTQSSVITVSETNTQLTISWTGLILEFLVNGDHVCIQAIQTALAPLPDVRSIQWTTGLATEQTDSWRMDYRQFIQNVWKLNGQEALSSIYPYYTHAMKKEKQTFPPIDFRLQCLGQTQKELLDAQNLAHAPKIQTQRTKIVAFKQEGAALHSKSSRFQIFSTFEKNKETFNSLLSKTPRIIKPNHGLNLHLLLDAAEIPADLIPTEFYMAELLGIGKIDIIYNAEFSYAPASAQVKNFLFSVQIKFSPKQEFRETIELYNGSSSLVVSNVYTNPEEMAYNYWYGLPYFDGSVYDLSNQVFIHKNPFLKRVALPRPLFALKSVNKNPARETIGKKIVEDHLKFLRQECNQKIAQLFLQPRAVLQQTLFKVESSVVLLQLFAALFIPGQLAEVRQEIAKIKGIKVSNYTARLEKTHEREHLAVTQEMLPSVKQIDSLATGKLASIIDKAETTGDADLRLLHHLLLTYKNAVQPVSSIRLTPEIPAGVAPTASTALIGVGALGVSALSTSTGVRSPSPTRLAEIEFLRSTLAAQSQQMHAMEAHFTTQAEQLRTQNSQLATEVHEMKAMLASLTALLTERRSVT